MKSKSFLYFGMLLVFLLTLSACQTAEGPTGESEAPATVVPMDKETPVISTAFDASKYENVFVFTLEEIENEGRSLLHISYPVTEQDAINARMEEISQEFIDEYRTTAAEIEESYQEYKKETGKEAATFITHYRQHFDVAVANENHHLLRRSAVDTYRRHRQRVRCRVCLRSPQRQPSCPCPISLSTTASWSVFLL